MTQLILAVNVPSTTPMTTGRETRQALPPGVWLGEQSYFAWSVKQSALEKKQELEAGLWDVVVMSPPCNAFSRVHFNWETSPGPQPHRNFNWPRGFPWLTGSNLQLVQDHNYLVDQTITTAHKCFQCNADFHIEHPEDLGACHGEWPASIG